MPSQLIPIVSLFSGPGGMDLGFRKAGFRPILAIDRDLSAVTTYNKNNRGKIAIEGDLAELSDEEIVGLVKEHARGAVPRGVIGGPPCQSFSVSNVHGKRNDPRKKLLLRYAEVIAALNREFNLDFFVCENVAGLKSEKHRGYFHKVLKAFEDAGFEVFESQLDASRFGVPQRRKRVFVVGINKQLYPNVQFDFPAGDPQLLVKVQDVLRGLPEPAYFRNDIKPEEIPHHPNHWTMNPRSPKFSNGFNGNGRSFRRLSWDEPSWTVAYGNREMHIHPNGNRRVSVFEAMLLQGFPKTYVLAGNLTQQVTQVSDAVPPALASAIANAVKKTIYKRKRRIKQGLLKWFEHNQRSFPWRNTRDPYKILLAEKLLQQTAAAKQVVEAYNEITRLYPTVESLSEADSTALKQIIEPLGFIYRANELPKLAQEILIRNEGKVPQSLKDLLDLPGIGDYSARAVLSFAYNQDVPIVDTNIARLLHRIYGITEAIPSNPARSKRLIDIAAALIPKNKSRDFNLAALDLCASLCTANKSNCSYCPIKKDCSHSQSHTASETVVAPRIYAKPLRSL